jgi:hypothetical protein
MISAIIIFSVTAIISIIDSALRYDSYVKRTLLIRNHFRLGFNNLFKERFESVIILPWNWVSITPEVSHHVELKRRDLFIR